MAKVSREQNGTIVYEEVSDAELEARGLGRTIAATPPPHPQQALIDALVAEGVMNATKGAAVLNRLKA